MISRPAPRSEATTSRGLNPALRPHVFDIEPTSLGGRQDGAGDRDGSRSIGRRQFARHSAAGILQIPNPDKPVRPVARRAREGLERQRDHPLHARAVKGWLKPGARHAEMLCDRRPQHDGGTVERRRRPHDGRREARRGSTMEKGERYENRGEQANDDQPGPNAGGRGLLRADYRSAAARAEARMLCQRAAAIIVRAGSHGSSLPGRRLREASRIQLKNEQGGWVSRVSTLTRARSAVPMVCGEKTRVSAPTRGTRRSMVDAK